MRLTPLRLGGVAVLLASLTFSQLSSVVAAGTAVATAPAVQTSAARFPWFPPSGPWAPTPGPWFPPGGSQPGQFPDGFPQGFQVPTSNETGAPVGGWGCDSTGQTDGGAVTRVPVLFVHGATRNAHDWDRVRQYYLDRGYTLCETWAVSYGNNSTQNFDTNDASAPTLEAFVHNMIDYLQTYKNANVTQIDVVTHSLGGTVVRKWLKNTGDYGLVRSFVEIAGPNHGLGICPGGPAETCRELTPGNPWLKDLNGNNEVPGHIRYMTIYDGTGRYDMFYKGQLKDSPALKGATNHPYNLEHGTRLDHVGLATGTVDLQLSWLSQDYVGK